ncbi:MAG: hypothetical protein JNK15_12980 [Planctomycetes bacterium]|nr:hypothetical protein [Planctomycetota bacterium]
MTGGQPPFAVQRVVFLALLGGMAAFALVVAMVLQGNGGRGLAETPIEMLDIAAVGIGATNAVLAFVLRAILHGRIAAHPPQQQATARFAATLVPIAVLEGGCMLALTAWMLNGAPFPNALVAGVLFAVAVTITPFRDPDRSDPA